MIEEIHAPLTWDGSEGLLAIIVRQDFHEPGITFFTAPEHSQQVAFMRHPAGHVVEPHTHLFVTREIRQTQEVLFLRRGRLAIDFYTSGRELVRQTVLEAGDVVILLGGGHGFQALEEVELYECKSGPYLGRERDKAVFE